MAQGGPDCQLQTWVLNEETPVSLHATAGLSSSSLVLAEQWRLHSFIHRKTLMKHLLCAGCSTHPLPSSV